MFLKGSRILLRKYPHIIKAMYINDPENIPEDLIVEENRQKSMVIEKYEEYVSRR